MPSPIHCDFSINHDRHKFVGTHVLELDNLMPLPRQLPPSARLLGILKRQLRVGWASARKNELSL
jgi:hypothetical protein